VAGGLRVVAMLVLRLTDADHLHLEDKEAEA
jgi:hypothetical protein